MDDERSRRVKAAYDELAEGDTYQSASTPPSAELLDVLAERLDPGARILDAGCGPGTPVADILGTRFQVVGLDVSRGQLRQAFESVPEANFLQGDMRRLPFSESSFRGIAAYQSIIHVPTAAHRTVFEEFARVLQPGGWLLFSSGTEAWEGENPDWLDSGVEMVWSYPDPETTIDWLEDVGFVLRESWAIADELADEGEKQFFLARWRGEEAEDDDR